ncbi:hypothetical protein ACIRL2_28600 [Embleya sp. NPDC127516]|uniref:hypothetical protein n=1 Tax=Embleya sp. NPDC127516 TaxID=3363990 RepID=UPI003830D16F
MIVTSGKPASTTASAASWPHHGFNRRRRRLIAIEGGPASGVTSVATRVGRALGITTMACPDPRFSELAWDHSLLSPNARTRIWQAALTCAAENQELLTYDTVVMAGYTATAMAALCTDLAWDTDDPSDRVAHIRDHLPPAHLTIHLRVSPNVARRRMRTAADPSARYLHLVASTPALTERLQAQARIAELFPGPVVDTDELTAEEAAAAVASLIREWPGHTPPAPVEAQ